MSAWVARRGVGAAGPAGHTFGQAHVQSPDSEVGRRIENGEEVPQRLQVGFVEDAERIAAAMR